MQSSCVKTVLASWAHPESTGVEACDQMLGKSHPETKNQFWGGHLWNPSCFMATVSDKSLKQITEYINSQKAK